MIRPQSQSTVIVQELSGNWAGLLRRQLSGDDIDVVRVETLDEMAIPLAANGWGVFALQIDLPGPANANAPRAGIEILNWLIESHRRFPHARFCGLSSKEALAWPIYEAGASLVIDHPLEVVKLARFVRQYHSTQGEFGRESQVAGTENVCESLWLRMPWKDHATATKLATKPDDAAP